jgi:hypothetical protein
MQDGLNLGTEHGGDLTPDSTARVVADLEVDTLPSLTPRDSLPSTTCGK